MDTQYILSKPVATKAADLKGTGFELLLDPVDGTMIAEFCDGSIVWSDSQLNLILSRATEGQQFIETAIQEAA
jgi:hypothetical protein